MRLKARRPQPRARDLRRGFTILELAITLAVMAMLATAILVPVVAQIQQRRIAGTEKLLEQAADALIGYATATGRLPCPAIDNVPADTGVEAFATAPPAPTAGTVANGICANFIGFLPAVTLGFTPVDARGYAVDGWGTPQNRIRYAVSNHTVPTGGTNTNPFTKTNGMRTATAGAIAGTPLLYVCNSGSGVNAGANCGTAVTLASNAPAVIWSVGANAATGGTGIDELQNPNPNGGSADRIFVSKIRTDITGAEFDDIVTWLSVGNLVSRMVLGGQLP